MASYRHKDGLKRGSHGGVSSHNTREDWANYYRKQNEGTWKYIEEIETRLEKERQEGIKKEQMEPKKFPSHLIEPQLAEHYTKNDTPGSLYFHKKKNTLVFDCCYGKFNLKIGCPIILSLKDSTGENTLYCCEIIRYNDKQVEVLICYNNEKRILPIKYEPPFLGIWESKRGSICWGRMPFQLFE